MMLTGELTGKDKGYPEFATALAEMLKSGKLPGGLRIYQGRHRRLAAPLGTAQTCQIVRAELVDPEGAVRLEAAKILSWAYSVTGEADQWQTYLDGRIAATAGDGKAYWLLARAYAESVAGSRPSPLKSKELFGQAIAAAVSASCRSAALSDLVYSCTVTRKYRDGEDLLDSAADRFPDAPTLAVIRSLRSELRQSGVRYFRDEARTMGARAEYIETKAQEAAVKGDKTSGDHYLRRARFYRERQKQLLVRADELST